MNIFQGPIDYVKAHPFITAGAVVAAYLVYVVLSRGNSSEAVQGTSVIYGNQADQMSLAQLQANSANYQTSQAAATQQAGYAAQISIAQLQADVQNAAITQSAAVQTNADNLSAMTTQVVAQLQALVANTNTQAQVAINSNNNAALVTVATAPYTTQIELAKLYYDNQPKTVAAAAVDNRAALLDQAYAQVVGIATSSLSQPGADTTTPYKAIAAYAGIPNAYGQDFGATQAALASRFGTTDINAIEMQIARKQAGY